MQIDWRRCATEPRQHQKDGVLALLKLPQMLLADEVGAGKSKQVVDTSQILYEGDYIDTVVVFVPAFARAIWANLNPAIGEVAKHGWPSIQNHIVEYCVNRPEMALQRPIPPQHLLWLVSNYEFIRVEDRLIPLLKLLANRRYWLVCDEAWALKDHKTATWKAVSKVRQMARRVTLLNGTPIADDPLDLFAQMKLLNPAILGFKYYGQFRSRYAVLKPNVSFPMITGWQNLEELRAKVAPHVLRRRTRDCFDLPPILEPITIEARLTEGTTWRTYKQMRDDMVAWIDHGGDEIGASIAKQAIVKGLRLAQITSGYLGGIQDMDLELNPQVSVDDVSTDSLLLMNRTEVTSGPTPPTVTKEIGREKLDAMLDWLATIDQPERLLIWCRFRMEIERAAAAFDPMSKHRHLARRMHVLYGGQSRFDREEAIAALNPAIDVDEPTGVVGTPAAGGAGLNLAGASLAINLSHDFNLRVFLQSRGRIDRLGQKHPIRYVDVVATGPKGQRTIDHHILAALRGKEDIAAWTAATWRKRLIEE
jgi:hypothetical protein